MKYKSGFSWIYLPTTTTVMVCKCKKIAFKKLMCIFFQLANFPLGNMIANRWVGFLIDSKNSDWSFCPRKPILIHKNIIFPMRSILRWPLSPLAFFRMIKNFFKWITLRNSHFEKVALIIHCHPFQKILRRKAWKFQKTRNTHKQNIKKLSNLKYTMYSLWAPC